MNIRKIDDSPHQIASTTRRHLLTATASGLIASAASASTVLGATSQLARQLVAWNTNEGIWRCWFEGHAADVAPAAGDAQELFGDRVKIQHVIAQDLEWLLGDRIDRLASLVEVSGLLLLGIWIDWVSSDWINWELLACLRVDWL